MATRTSSKLVTFQYPFLLTGIDELLPAGGYNVETDEESLEAISSLAWRRMSTTLHLNAKPGSTVVAQVS